MRCSILVLATALVCAAAAPTLADGKGFAPPQAGSVQTADQRAAIVWMDGHQKLVIETTLRSSAAELAWVVPTPAVPEVEPATQGFFPTLDYLFAPRLVTMSSAAVIVPFFALLLLALVMGRLVRLSVVIATLDLHASRRRRLEATVRAVGRPLLRPEGRLGVLERVEQQFHREDTRLDDHARIVPDDALDR